jgi:RNA polymerase sigma factor (sigma-70 family)
MVIDAELLNECKKGNRRACNLLYEKLFSYLMNICIRYNGNYDEAGSSLNAIFLKIINNLKKRDENKHIFPWIKAIAMNHLADEFRKSKVLKENIEFNDLSNYQNISHFQTDNINLETADLLKMIQKLPPVCKQIFNLYAIDGYNHREIGEMLGINEGTSKSQLHVARCKLQKMLEEDQPKLKIKPLEKAG